MFEKSKVLFVVFFISFITQSIAQKTESDFEKIIDVTINVSTGRIEIDESQIQDLHVFLWGRIQLNVYGLYKNTISNPIATERQLSISSSIITTTLAPILIPPTTPDPDDRHVENNKILLGALELDMLRFDATPGLKNATLTLSETDNTLADQKTFSFTLYNPELLGDLEITHIETIVTNEDRKTRNVRIIAHVRNTGRDDINEASKVKFYIRTDDGLKLIRTKTVQPIQENNSIRCIIIVKYETYVKMTGKQLYSIVDEDNMIRERNDYNNHLNYEVPEIQINPDTIKVFPNPFKDRINFTFFLDQNASPLVVLNLYNKFGKKIAMQGYVLPPNNTYQTITYFNNDLPKEIYIYTLGVGNTIYQGRIMKK